MSAGMLCQLVAVLLAACGCCVSQPTLSPGVRGAFDLHAKYEQTGQCSYVLVVPGAGEGTCSGDGGGAADGQLREDLAALDARCRNTSAELMEVKVQLLQETVRSRELENTVLVQSQKLAQLEQLVQGLVDNQQSGEMEVGNCTIFRGAASVGLGVAAPGTYRLGPRNSCVTDDNKDKEVHVIGTYGNATYNSFRTPDRLVPKDWFNVKLVQRGPLTKPLVLVMASYYPMSWDLDIPDGVTIDTVHVSGQTSSNFAGSSQVSAPTGAVGTTVIDWIHYGYGYDHTGGSTALFLKKINELYGPVTSYTGYQHFKSVILQVGGDPLEVVEEPTS
ncbi:uncharacterized protein [Branchiostoma lanceolatum]|uniref:uncharacterized protein isoform X2 n=1 Tax=Branchiostoma lanceolatum TaxID=7740 RepID=UPI0034560341